MEQKKTNRSKKIAVNPSGGVRKVETIEQEIPSATKTSVANKTNTRSKSGTGSKSQKTTSTKKTITAKAELENTKADKRYLAAKAKAERKELKKEQAAKKKEEYKMKKLEARERALERKVQARERARERKVAREMRKDQLRNETAVQRLERKERERAEKIQLKKQNQQLKHALAVKKKEEREHNKALKQNDRKNKREQRLQRRHAPGYGGWLAAVISLGVVTLAMGSLLTYGAMNMRDLNQIMGMTYRSNLYEMTEISESLSSDLNKLRVATGEEEQRKILTDILVKSELLEGSMERFPVDMATTTNIAGFVNRTGEFARQGLNQIATRGAIGMEQEDSLEYMYATNARLTKELRELQGTMSEKDWNKLMKQSQDNMANERFSTVNDNAVTPPSTIQDGPFAENKQKVTAHGIENEKEISVSKATAKVKEMFVDYSLKDVEYKGEVTGGDMALYNFTLTDTRGRKMYAQLSKMGGKLIMFDSYEKCAATNFNQEKCVEIAQEFLTGMGMKNMHPVWLQENGTTANINFVYKQDGVLCYSDMVVVKVCETKGIVTGVEAYAYYLNHGERKIEKPQLTEEEAVKALGKLTPETGRLALIPYEGNEALCYEFSGTYNGQEYFVYVDAKTGAEVQMFNVLNTKQGRVLR